MRHLKNGWNFRYSGAGMDGEEQPATILLCRCEQAQVVSEETVSAVRGHLVEAGAAFHETADLCGLAARSGETLSSLAAAGDVLIAACFPRAVRWLFSAAGAQLPVDRTEIVNMRNGCGEHALGDIAAWLEKRGHSAFSPVSSPVSSDSDWAPWFPVIDYERCTGCMQCLSFCLFGVFDRASDEGGNRVTVGRPANCKTNCPACARVCPAGAIIFPKYKDSPINGAETAPGDEGAPVAVNPAALGPDIYAALRRRRARQGGSRQRFAPAASADYAAAEAERAQFKELASLAEKLDVPAELTRSLFPIASAPAGCVCNCECMGDGDCDCECDCPCAPGGRE